MLIGGRFGGTASSDGALLRPLFSSGLIFLARTRRLGGAGVKERQHASSLGASFRIPLRNLLVHLIKDLCGYGQKLVRGFRGIMRVPVESEIALRFSGIKDLLDDEIEDLAKIAWLEAYV